MLFLIASPKQESDGVLSKESERLGEGGDEEMGDVGRQGEGGKIYS